ncbi:MAG: tetratricopeptide repeat protein [Phycisphaerales bacterium]
MRRAAPILAALLLLAAYWPALGAGWIWDDDSYVWRNAVVQSPSGIVDCWVPGRTPQWYPLVFLSFWAQHAVHGLEPAGYHLVNVVLHGLSAFLLWRLLRALGLAGAGLAATLFLLHPMQVESVAWVTERKNVLSMAFALGAILAWVRWLSVPAGGRGAVRHAAAAFALFVLAMLSKTTAVAVPVAMAAVAWWRPWPALAGEARPVRRVAVVLAPFFVLGIAMGLFTAWIEVTVVGASGGAEFRRGLAERVLQAAQAWWWYLGAWAVPTDLSFVHPAFAPGAWRGALAVAAGAALFAACAVRARRGTRGPLAWFLVYSAAVFPALGILNLYPLRYAPVAEHFGYVASTVMAAALAWGAVHAWARIDAAGAARRAGAALVAAVAVTLAGLSNAHARAYADAETLWRATLERNPDAWLASNNLVVIVLERMQAALDAGDRAAADALIAEAEALSERSVALAGAIDASVMANLSEVRRVQGRTPEALAAAERAAALEPEGAEPQWQLGRLLELSGRGAEAGEHYRRSVERAPRNQVHLREWVRWLTAAGRLAEARDVAARIVALAPADAEARGNLGSLALELGDLPSARRDLRAALALSRGDESVAIAARCIRALLAVPTDPESCAEARSLAERLVGLTGGGDPLSMLMLARAQAMLADPAARTTLARADALLAAAPAEVREAAAAERAAAEAALQGSGMP